MFVLDSDTMEQYSEKGGLLPNENRMMGARPVLKNASIHFAGSGNTFYCEENVTLEGCTLRFLGNNAVIYLGSNKHPYKLAADINNDVVLHMGRNNYMNQLMRIILSEQRHCFIGNSGVFSTNIYIRNSDPHLIYDCKKRFRINPTKSVYIGDHVWIGQGALILKGTQIDSGSIIGAMSVVAGKKSRTIRFGEEIRPGL